MAVDFFYPAYEVVRNQDRCITCRVCERQCANGVHQYDEELGLMISDESQCVNCQRCVTLCPTRALKIVKTDNTFKSNVNWTQQAMTEIYRQAESGGVLLSAMGNPQPMPVYWDKMLINASQVTNPSIDPLREPMETRTYLGARPDGIRRDAEGNLIDDTPPQLKLEVPIMFSAMSYGSISYNAHESLARAAVELGTYYNTGEGGLHQDFYKYGIIPLCRWPPDASGCIRIISTPARPLKSKWGRAPSRASADTCRERKSWVTSPVPA